MSTQHLATGDANYQARALQRGLAVLRSFDGDQRDFSLLELSKRLDLAKSTLFRLLQVLQADTFVEQDAAGRWRLGLGAFKVGSAYIRQLSFTGIAQGALERLAATCCETASLAVLADGEVVYIAIVRGQREIGIQSNVGARHPVHCTALGKVLLAYRPEAEVRATLIRQGMPRNTEHTIITVDAFEAALLQVRRLGYAVDDEERAYNIRCVAAPIHEGNGNVIAALSASGPIFRLDDIALDQLREHVVAAAEFVSQRLGYMETAAPVPVR
jgi:DNA-binding IclR family transcriptional regulator